MLELAIFKQCESFNWTSSAAIRMYTVRGILCEVTDFGVVILAEGDTHCKQI
jgi:hypothetical protein